MTKYGRVAQMYVEALRSKSSYKGVCAIHSDELVDPSPERTVIF